MYIIHILYHTLLNSFKFWILFLLGIGLLSCKKQDDTISFDSKLAESEISMIMAIDDIEYITYEGMELSNNIMEAKTFHDEGPLGVACVKTSFSIQQNTTTIDFGEGCEGPDQKVRKGRIIISQTGKYFEPGTVVTSILENYSVNDIQIEGTLIITNTSPERTMNPTFTVNIENGKAIWPDQSFATREINYTRTWNRSSDHNEMIYLMSGISYGISRNGNSYTSEINNSLKYKLSCLGEYQFFPVEGKVTLFPENDSNYQIDYGSGNCDNKIKITFNENIKEVALY